MAAPLVLALSASALPSAQPDARPERRAAATQDLRPYRVVELPADANGVATMQVIISPSAIRAKRLANGLKPEPPEMLLPPWEIEEGGIAGGCGPQTVTYTDASFTGGAYNAQGGFAEQEIAAVSYTLPPSDFPAKIIGSEMIFATSNATIVTKTEWSWIVIQGEPPGVNVGTFSSQDGDLPSIFLGPGTQGVNVQVIVDPGDPEQIFVGANAANAFAVGYRIDKHQQQTQNPCLVAPPSCCNAFPTTDVSGLAQPTKNWLFALNCGLSSCAGWKRFSELPSFICKPTGDWVLRATYLPASCVPVAGACCLSNGNCLLVTSGECGSIGGTFAGANTICEQTNCQPPTGACCFPNGTCQQLTSGQCSQQGGTYQGNNSLCSGVTCPEANGPCCFPATGNCISLKASQCIAAGGVPGPAGQSCAGYVCFPKGACCLPDGSCAANVSPESCASLNGIYQGNNSQCGQVICPEPMGACCFGTGFCLELSEFDCALTGASWGGVGSICGDGNGNGLPDGCEPASVFGDLNGDGLVNGADLGLLLSQWGGAGSGDLNGDGTVDGADLGALLAAWSG